MDQSKGERTRERIVHTAAELFLKNGYHATGLADILREAAVPKGSFYYAFPSKQALGVAAAEHFRQSYGAWFRSALDRSDDWEGFVDVLIEDISGQIAAGAYFGCPFSCFATEAAPTDAQIAAVCVKAMEEFCGIFAQALARALPEDTARRRAADALSLYEGYLVCYRLSGSAGVIQRMREGLRWMGACE